MSERAEEEDKTLEPVSENQGDDEEVERETRPKKHVFKSKKGQRMAKIVAECILLRYFFPNIKDRKKCSQQQAQFLLDMRFNLSTGIADKTSSWLTQRLKQ